MTNAFQKNQYSVRSKIVKITRISEKLEYLKDERAKFWTKRMGPPDEI
jgi:hypothetical protein